MKVCCKMISTSRGNGVRTHSRGSCGRRIDRFPIRRPLPQPPHTVGVEDLLVGDQGQIGRDRLRDQKAVERVAMWAGQAARPLGAPRVQRQVVEAVGLDRADEVGGNSRLEWQLAQPVLGGDLEDRHGAHEHGRVVGVDGLSRDPGQA